MTAEESPGQRSAEQRVREASDVTESELRGLPQEVEGRVCDGALNPRLCSSVDTQRLEKRAVSV